MLVDYHVHTDNSFDCKTPMVEMCAQAIEVGVEEIAFTDHLNNNLLDIDLGYYDPDRYFDNIEYCRSKFPQLSILAGVELGEPHRWYPRIQPIIERYPYDIVLGSVHWVGRDNVFDVRHYYSRTHYEIYKQYFTEVLEMVRHGGFDVVAHVDLPKRVSFGVYGEYDSGAYEDLIRPVWQACLENNVIPEINTKGLRMPVNQPHPSLEALTWYVEMGGQALTIGSDAHRADSVSSHVRAAQQSALEAGITRICRFRKRQVIGWIDPESANTSS